MMFKMLIEIKLFAAGQPLLMGIPESIGLLAFGLGLTVTAVIIRRYLGRSDAERRENDGTKNV